jgi:hypothetical protein
VAVVAAAPARAQVAAVVAPVPARLERVVAVVPGRQADLDLVAALRKLAELAVRLALSLVVEEARRRQTLLFRRLR